MGTWEIWRICWRISRPSGGGNKHVQDDQVWLPRGKARQRLGPACGDDNLATRPGHPGAKGDHLARVACVFCNQEFSESWHPRLDMVHKAALMRDSLGHERWTTNNPGRYGRCVNNHHSQPGRTP